MTVKVACDGVSAGWGARKLLDSLSLSFSFDANKDCLPIIGRTGIGKSTLLYVLSGMARPSSGSVAWRIPVAGIENDVRVSWGGGGEHAFDRAVEPRAAAFGVLLQDAAMINCFTVEENLRHVMHLRGTKGSRAEKRDRIRRAVAAMAIEEENVDELLVCYPGRLSGGQRQRMALAAATVHDPVVLFADEPTASLDNETGVQVLSAVRKWLDEAPTAHARGFVCVTHNLPVLEQGLHVDRAMELKRVVGSDGVPSLHLHEVGLQ